MSNRVFRYSVTQKKERYTKAFWLIFNVVFIVFFLNVIVDFFIFPVKQNSVSMTPDLEDGSLVLVTPILNNVKRGDVVLLKPQLKEEYSGFTIFCDSLVRLFTAQQVSLLKKSIFPGTKEKFRRVIGVPGDTIYMRDYVMYIKPEGEKHFLTEFEFAQRTKKYRPYNVTFMSAPPTWDNEIGVKGYFDEIVLGENEYFVLGDNRKACDDSRLWGTISKNDMKARALCCYFPFKKMRVYAQR
ncbi:MAG: signal peptidase I [Treponema sp.]|nr:signal peptidase I [Treponema sp.]